MTGEERYKMYFSRYKLGVLRNSGNEIAREIGEGIKGSRVYSIPADERAGIFNVEEVIDYILWVHEIL